MEKLNLKPTSKPIKAYYETTQEKKQMGFVTEGNVAPAFAHLIGYCAKQAGYLFNEQHSIKVGKRTIRFDGAILTVHKLRYGIWEAKDSADSLDKEIKAKFASGYPNDNILFQAPDEAVLIQDGREVMRADLTQPQALIDILNTFFSYVKPVYDEWERSVAEFKTRVPEIAQKLDAIIEAEYKKRGAYTNAFDAFHDLCRVAINPNLSKDAVEEMLIQHILTERIFRRVFNNDKFSTQNIIAREIEKVVDALTSTAWNRAEFLRGLDHFYGAIETTASTISDYSEKQAFLNTVYEQFFQGFSVDVADTHGIVYTPQPIVQFMVKSVDQLLRDQFGGRSLADDGVHILDPFVGTGNFMLRVIEEIRETKPSALPHKYAHELHCNEVMLLPYYIASMNIEHAYYEAQGRYVPFEGICLVDTFDLAEARQMGLFTQANLARVERQRNAPLTVILGNPPYNAWQVNENDNNKNRKYPVIDGRVQETYVKNSTATLRNALYDPYVKAFRWASDRIGDEGVIAFITNSGFVEGIAFDGMRYHLRQDFDAVYILDLGGNSRKTGRGEKVSNVFDIRVGVCITFLVRKKQTNGNREGKIYYYQTSETGNKADKFTVLDEAMRYSNITWREIIPTQKHVWLTDGMEDDFETFLPIGTQDAKRGDGQAIFELFSNGIKTNRDSVIYDFNVEILSERMKQFVDDYNSEVDRYRRANKPLDIDNFVKQHIKWDGSLKDRLRSLRDGDFSPNYLRNSLYRPFCKKTLYFDWLFINRTYQFPRIFPTPATEQENRVIWLKVGREIPMFALMANTIVDLLPQGGSQCFPLYVYDTDGTNRRENISDWALGEYRRAYGDETISKADIFYAIYALLHHPGYREKYAQNLKRELPRVPFVSLPHPLAPSPLHGEGEHSLPLRSGGRVGDGGGFDGDGDAPHPLTPSPLHGEGEHSLPLRSGGRVGDGGGFDGDGDGFEDLPHIPRPATELWADMLKPLARQMRHDSTPAEKHLWGFVRKNQIAGAYFRRQHPIDRFIVDFYCHEARLIIEVDGEIHQYTQEEDAIRQAFLESLGLHVLRFSNEAVLHDTMRVLKVIEDAINEKPLPLTPLHGEGEHSLPLRSGGRVGDGGGFDALTHPLHGEGEHSLPLRSGGRVGDGGGFHYLAHLGRALADLHLHYETAPEYALVHVENPKVPPSYRVEAMRLNKDKTALVVNDFLTLEGIPQAVYDYKLGNRSALEWVIDQYRVTTDKRSGIVNDPNRADDERYIVNLVGRVVHVSLETVRLVDEIAKFEF